jgi:hypothetical protein
VIKGFLVTAAKEGMSQDQASAAIKGLMSSTHRYEGDTPIDKVIADSWSSANATAEGEKAFDRKDAKRQMRGGDAF